MILINSHELVAWVDFSIDLGYTDCIILSAVKRFKGGDFNW